MYYINHVAHCRQQQQPGRIQDLGYSTHGGDGSSMSRKANSKARPGMSLRTIPDAQARTVNDDAPDPSESDTEVTNDAGSQSSSLTVRQQAVLPVLALSPSVAQAARESGVSERTLRRWLDDPTFQDEISRLNRGAYEIARKQLQALVPHLISVIAAEAMENPDPTVRIRAARYALNYAAKFSDVDRLADDVDDLRAALLRL